MILAELFLLISLVLFINGTKYAPNIQLWKDVDGRPGMQVTYVNMHPYNNTILDIEPVETKYVENKFECVGACVMKQDVCKSANMIPTGEEGNFTCQILDGDKYRNVTSFTPRTGTTHFAIQVIYKYSYV